MHVFLFFSEPSFPHSHMHVSCLFVKPDTMSVCTDEHKMCPHYSSRPIIRHKSELPRRFWLRNFIVAPGSGCYEATLCAEAN